MSSLHLCLHWADFDLIFFSELVQWLWPTLIQQELDQLKAHLNNHVVRYDAKKKLPSGMSANTAYSLYAENGGEWCLQDVDREIIQHLKVEIGGEGLLRFVSVEYEVHAKKVFESLDYGKILLQNVWSVFADMLPLVRGHPQLYVPLHIPYLIFIFHLHFALLTYLFVTVWLPP